MYGPDKRTPMGNWDVRKADTTDKGIVIDTPETNTNKPTHMELSILPNQRLSFTAKIDGKGGTEELEACSGNTQ